MDKVVKLTGWTYWQNYKPQRKGSYFTIEKDRTDVDACVMDWLDDNLQRTTYAKATYIWAKRFSWNNGSRDGVADWFAIAL